MTQQEFIRAFHQADCLDVLRDIPTGTVKLIYMDPPWSKNARFQSISGKAVSTAYSDMWRDADPDETWYGEIVARHGKFGRAVAHVATAAKAHSKAVHNYIMHMAIRLFEMKRVLDQNEGCIFYHCDPDISHYVKLLMDAVFGKGCYRNEIALKHSVGSGGAIYTRRWREHHQVVLFYAMPKATIDANRPPTEREIDKMFRTDEQGRKYRIRQLHMPKHRGPSKSRYYEFKGHLPPFSSGWLLSRDRMQQEYDAGNIIDTPDGLQRRVYLEDYVGYPIGDVWGSMNEQPGVPSPGRPTKQERKYGYPTQKARALLERIIRATTKPGDLVLDPFCGGGTALVQAEMMGRQWIGIDRAEDGAPERLLRMRLASEAGLNPNGVVEFDKRDYSHLTPKPAPELKPQRKRPEPKGDQLDALLAACGGNRHAALAALEFMRGVEHYCKGCNRVIQTDFFEADHVVAKSQGGADTLDNMQLLCSSCNKYKSNRDQAEFESKKRTQRHYGG